LITDFCDGIVEDERSIVLLQPPRECERVLGLFVIRPGLCAFFRRRRSLGLRGRSGGRRRLLVWAYRSTVFVGLLVAGLLGIGCNCERRQRDCSRQSESSQDVFHLLFIPFVVATRI